MRVNVYAEEMTDRVEIITKKAAYGTLTGVCFYLELPVTQKKLFTAEGASLTLWGKRDLRAVLRKALDLLDAHYCSQQQEGR